MGLLLSLIGLMAGGAAAFANRRGRVRWLVLTCLLMAAIGFGLVVQQGRAMLIDGSGLPPELPLGGTVGMVLLILGATLGVAFIIGRLLHKRASWVSAMILGGLSALIIVIALFLWTF